MIFFAKVQVSPSLKRFKVKIDRGFFQSFRKSQNIEFPERKILRKGDLKYRCDDLQISEFSREDFRKVQETLQICRGWSNNFPSPENRKILRREDRYVISRQMNVDFRLPIK